MHRVSNDPGRYDNPPISVYQSAGDSFLEMAHLALKLRADILDQYRHEGFHISEDEAISDVHQSLFIFICLLLGSQNLFDCDYL